jgi:hypothetical protein
MHDRRREALDARMRRFHDVDTADVLGLVDYLREPGDTVVAGGSLTFGLGNRLSDFDVVICGPATPSSAVPLQHWAGSLRVDVWTRAHADLDRLFRHAEQALDGEAPIEGAFGTVEEEQQLKLLHRAAFGLDLDGPPLAPRCTRDHVEVARDLVVREYAERMRESAYLARLALTVRRPLAAAVNARFAVEEAAHVVLAAGGVPFSGDKWLADRLAEHAPRLGERHGRLTELPENEDGAAGFVADAVTLCRELTGLDTSLDALGTRLSWVSSGLVVHRVGGEDLLLAPDIGGLWVLSEPEAAAWRSLTAGESGDAATRRSWRADRCDRDQADLCLGLYQRGLAQPRWHRGVPVADLSPAEVVAR